MHQHHAILTILLLANCYTRFEAQARAPVEVTHLTCESLLNPTGIDVMQPRLAWRMNATERGQRQTAYQVLVASAPGLLAQDKGDLWNSGKVASAQASQLVCGLKPLPSHAQAFWKVRVWDATNQASPWSQVAQWSMGLLHPADWQSAWIGRDDAKPASAQADANSLATAQWIWSPDGDANSAPAGQRWFRRDFDLAPAAKVRSAILLLAIDEKCQLSLNGKLVASGASWHDLARADVAKILVAGRNTLRVAAENFTGPAGLMVSLDIVLEDGRKVSVITDNQWQSALDAKEDAAWGPAKVLGNNGMAPWGPVSATPSDKIYLPATYLRRDFRVAQAPVRAVLYVTALGCVEPHLNGERVGDEYFTPGWTDYRQRLYYRAYDVTGRIKPGANTLGAILGDGWFRGNISNLGQNRYGQKTRLKAQLHLFYKDGRQEIIASDNSWQAGFGPILESDMQAGESYDARREMPGWDQPDFVGTNWQTPATGAEVQPVVQAYPGVPVRRIAEVKSVAISAPKPGLYVVNFGQNFAGWVRLKTSEAASTAITLRFGEMLNSDGTVYRENLRSARATDTYICKGGNAVWEPHFTYHGFQYAEIEGLTKAPSLDTITGISVHSDAAQTGDFECSSALINKIFQNTLWGQRSNYLEVPTDCPQRDERLGWTGDTQVLCEPAPIIWMSTHSSPNG